MKSAACTQASAAEIASASLSRILKERSLRASHVAVRIAGDLGCPIASAQSNMHKLIYSPPVKSKWWGFVAHALEIKLADLNPDPLWIDRNMIHEPSTPTVALERRLRILETKVNALLNNLHQLKADIHNERQAPTRPR